MDTAPPLVEMAGITKRYGGVLACDAVDLTVRAGEVHALLGENGAGKSTLMKVLSGDISDHAGQITIEGHSIQFAKPADAQHAGIAMIHQELDLVPGLSVAENLHLGREPRTRLGVVDRRAMSERTRELLRRTGIDLDPNRPVGELRVGEQQLVTIARALSLNAKVMIMDEPTSALSTAEVERLFGVIGELRRNGTGIVYISHRMDEIGQVADRATVLRNGRKVAEFDAQEMTAEQAAEAMVGRTVQTRFQSRTVDVGEELLRIKGFAVRPKRTRVGRREPDGIDLTVRSGEIVGLCGLLGAGRTASGAALGHRLRAGGPAQLRAGPRALDHRQHRALDARPARRRRTGAPQVRARGDPAQRRAAQGQARPHLRRGRHPFRW